MKYTTSDWNTGFTASVKITNGSSSAINGWSLAFAFPAGQQMTNCWSGAFTQTGCGGHRDQRRRGTGRSPAGGSVELGFNGSHTGTNTKPTAFTLNGTTCTTG